jgi:lantibiotic biosynthesis protein
MVGRLVLDTYYPEIGRYGHSAALDAAEDVFAADSRVAAAGLRTPPTVVHPTALVVTNMVGIASVFLGGPAKATDWLVAQPVPAAPAIERAVTDQAIRLATAGTLRALPGWADEFGQAWQARADALAAYRKQLPPDVNVDVVVESLLHVHHNRAIGIDPDSERTCRRLARQAAITWRAQRAGNDR